MTRQFPAQQVLAASVLTSASLLALPSVAAEVTTLEEVVVTAAKRTENIQDVASSVTAIGGELINRVQADNLADLDDYVPGLNVIPAGVSANRLVIRGLTTGPNDLSPTVGVYVNDVPFGSNSGFALGALFSPDVDPGDLERVEVLRGPQGTLYGASTLAGLVKYVTRAPDVDKFDGHFRADYGTTDDSHTARTSFRGGVSIPLAEGKMALRLSGYYTYAEGNTVDERTGRSGLNTLTKYGGFADLLIKPTDALSIDLTAIVDDSDTPHIGSVDGDALTLEPVYSPVSGYGYVDGFAKSNYTVLSANISYQFSNGITATSSTSWSRLAVNLLADDTTIFQPAFAPIFGPFARNFQFQGPVIPHTEKTTEELRLTSPAGGPFEWLAGLFYDDESSRYIANITSTYGYGETPPPAFLAPYVALFANYESTVNDTTYKEKAAFANATYRITPTFDVSAGLRYTQYDQDRQGTATGFLVLIGVIPASSTSTYSDSVLTGSLDARWHFSPNAMAYARAAEGYRPGGPTTNGSFNPDKTWNYELGLKGTALDGKLSGDIAAFYIDWKDIQLNFFNGTNTVIGNAGDAHSQGIEVEGTYSPIERLTLSANAAYTDAKIDGLVDGAQGGAAVGDPLPYSSKWAAALRADYFFPLTGSIEGNVGAGLRYKSEFNTTFPGDTGTRFYRLPSETFFDLRAGMSWSSYTLNLQVLNVGDERKLAGASQYMGVSQAEADAFGQPVFLAYTPGRTYALSFTARY